jgi:CHAD domain-containing protein
MAYALQPGRSVGSEVRRVADKQLELALAQLQGVGVRPSDTEPIHDARKHVKKVRALIRLIQPAFGRTYRRANKRLRAVSRLLSSLSDGEAVVGTVGRLVDRHRDELHPRAMAMLRKALIARHARIARQARADRVIQRAPTLLERQRWQVPEWRLTESGFDAVAAGLDRRVGLARQAMADAIAAPTTDTDHRWRRRVKDHWLEVRLLELRCGDALKEYERRLETLDGCLGEYHNTVLLQEILRRDVFLPRPETALVLRALRRYQRELRHEALRLAADIYDERSRTFVKRVRRHWLSVKNRATTPSPPVPPWAHAA